MSSNIQKWIGNFLIFFSLFGLVYIYYPYVKELFFPHVYTQAQKDSISFSIQIPKIKLFSEIIPNVDPYKEAEYLEKLKLGVAHAKTSRLPGEGGTIYLFAHSSDVPWRITQYNTAFFKLDFLERGDEVIIKKNGVEYKYVVIKKMTVWPNEISYLNENQGNVLILQTCTPVGTALQRLLVFARPVQ